MKFNISPSCLEEISHSILKEPSENIFWGALFNDHDFDNPEVETLYQLPTLMPKNLEKVFSSQEISFDALLVFENNTSKQDLKIIKEFCADMGLYFLSANSKLEKSNSTKFKNLKNNPTKISVSKKIEEDKTEFKFKKQTTQKETLEPIAGVSDILEKQETSNFPTSIPFHLIAKVEEQEKNEPRKPSFQSSEAKSYTYPIQTIIEGSQNSETLTTNKEKLIEIDTSVLREKFINPTQGFQKRNQQITMIRTILDCFEQTSHAFIEAATGTGKSLAYLLPSILLAEQTGERVVISTYTKSLQTQLMEKDIPKAIEMLGSNIKAGLVKGKSNYLCLRRFFDYKSHITQQTGLFLAQEDLENMIEILEKWLTTTISGDLDSVSGNIRAIIGEVNTQSELCNKKKCPYFKDCYYYKLWAQLEEAKIIVVNHALLVSQMEMDFQEIDHELIPFFQHIIIDEAHHFPKTALKEEAFSSSYFTGIIARLASGQEKKKGFISHLGNTVKNMDIHFEYTSFLNKIIDIENSAVSLKAKIQIYLDILPKLLSGKEYYRITAREQEYFINYQSLWEDTKNAILIFISSIDDLQKDMQNFAEEFKESQSILYQQIEQAKSQLAIGTQLWSKIFTPINQHTALWLEEKGDHYTLYFVDVDNENFLQSCLWDKYKSVILTSATLSINHSLDDLKTKLFFMGEAKELLLPPVFKYKDNCLFLSVNNLPIPIDPNFNTQSCDLILQSIQEVKGGVLILATSNDQMNTIAEFLENANIKRPLLVQNRMNIASILEEAKKSQNAVLVGVDSFWEGIDLPGDALELVFLTKIPFKPPGHPVTDVLSEIEKQAGNNPFNTITLAEATMKFKQGFGRLLRTESDRGIVICLDHRLTTKYYGKTIQNSLYSPVISIKQNQLLTEIKAFFN